MAVPRRIVSGALRRVGIPSASRASTTFAARATSYHHHHLAPRSQFSAARAAAATSISFRAYSTDSGDRVPGSRPWTFSEINEQLKINKELEKSGKSETADGKAKVIFVDVREPQELFDTGKIPGAINIPVTTNVQAYHISDDEFFELYDWNRPPKDAHLMFYCKAGVRAKSAAALAQHAGWTNIGEYTGSWLDWAKQKGPVEPHSKS